MKNILSLVSPFGSVMVTPKDPIVYHTTDSIIFSCHSEAGPYLNYSWVFNREKLLDDVTVNSTQLIVRNINYLLGETFTCVVMNIAGVGNKSSTLFGKFHNCVCE